MSNTYPVGIHIARLSYLDEIPSASAALRYVSARRLIVGIQPAQWLRSAFGHALINIPDHGRGALPRGSTLQYAGPAVGGCYSS
jgi:hypothetical protein